MNDKKCDTMENYKRLIAALRENDAKKVPPKTESTCTTECLRKNSEHEINILDD